MAGNVYHSWNGTVLTITSDSGTSSANLKGDDGARGAQGAAGGTCYEVCVAPTNLLDNSYFINPINQRGQAEYTGSGYTIDRWRTWENGTITLTNEGIKGDGTQASVLYQPIESYKIKVNKTYTVAAGYSDGTIVCQSGVYIVGEGGGLGIGNEDTHVFLGDDGNGTPVLRLWHATKIIQWVAIYEGEYTLETLPPYNHKGYAAELMECQRYYRKHITYNLSGISTVAGWAAFGYDYTSMRTTPTVTADIEGLYYSITKATEVTNLSARAKPASEIICATANLPAGTICMIRFNIIELSADL